MARQVLENGVVLPAEYSDDWYDDMTSNLTKLDDVIGSDSEKLSSADVGAAALSNNYNDLDNLPTIPTVNDATLTIQKNGVDVQTFTANASSNVTANITVPTKTSDLTNDSNFVDTSNAAVSSGITSAKVTDYDTHIADIDIHVTTADKNKWNNQTYVFRYSSTALTASSTNSNALLDNTDNLKVGDKVIDSSGVLFSITAIDTENSTFTIGTALIDLAQDSDVVHKSGNETVGGEKTFTGALTASRNVANGEIILQNASYDPKTNGQGGVSPKSFSVNFVTALSDTFGAVSCYGVNDRTILRFTSRYFVDSQTVTEDSVEYNVYGDGSRSFKPRNNNNTMLGESTRKWKEVYANNYYYGANNVEFSTKFVTTDTNQTISGVKTFEGVDLKLKSVYGEYTVSSGNTSLLFYDKNSLLLSQYKQGIFGSGLPYQNFNIVGYDSNNQQVNKSITFSSSYLDLSTAFLKPETDNAIALGRTINRWSDVQTYKVNALEPSSLSLPSGNANNVIDISSYITDLSGNVNSYTVPANGWISIAVIGSFIAIVSSRWSDSRLRESSGNVRMLYPVLKNETVSISIAGTTLAYARFIPCQGNV